MNIYAIAAKKASNTANECIDNLVFGFQDLVHVYCEAWVFDDDTTVSSVTKAFNDFSIVQVSLCRDTTTIQAGSAELRLLNQGNLATQLGCFDSRYITCRSATDNNDIVSIITLIFICAGCRCCRSWCFRRSRAASGWDVFSFFSQVTDDFRYWNSFSVTFENGNQVAVFFGFQFHADLVSHDFQKDFPFFDKFADFLIPLDNLPFGHIHAGFWHNYF